MLGRVVRQLGITMVATGLVLASVPHAVIAAGTECTVNINPGSVAPTAGANFTVSVSNYGSQAIRWVDITVDANSFIFTGNSISGWITSDHPGGTTAYNGSISPGSTKGFDVSATADFGGSSASWTIMASSDSGGGSPVQCTGTTSTSISGLLPQDQNVAVSEVTVSSITTNSAVIEWVSDLDTSSLVYYGKTNNYDKRSAYDTNRASSHTVSLTGLAENTTYHFQVAGSDGNGGFAYSSDNTFVTNKSPTSTTGGGGSSSGSGNGGASSSNSSTKTPTSIPKASRPKSAPPAASLTTKLSGAYTTAPVISGMATDDAKVALIEYSTDNGRNWLPVDSAGKPDKKVSFSFTPLVPLDGNYVIVARATDEEGQIGLSSPLTLVIDKLPPAISGSHMSIGPQSLQPNKNGVMEAAQYLDQRITVQAVGGPTSIVIDAVQGSGKTAVTQSFTLTQSPDTGLWSGVLSYRKTGSYVLTVRAVDGANNATSRKLGTVFVRDPARVVDAKSGSVVPGQVEVWYRDPATKNWLLWDAASYGQLNPARQEQDGGFAIYLPAGTYYLRTSAKNYRTQLSKSFSIQQPMAISPTIKLSRVRSLHFGPITLRFASPSIQQSAIDIGGVKAAEQETYAQNLPLFTEQLSKGTQLSTTDLYGKPTVMTFFATWSPPARDQLAILNDAQAKDFNAVAVSSGESPARLEAYAQIAGYTVPIVADTDSSLTQTFSVGNLPTTIVFDRSGGVKARLSGVVSKEELLKYVTQ